MCLVFFLSHVITIFTLITHKRIVHLNDPKSLVLRISIVRFNQVLRSGNQPARHLPKLALLGSNDFVWWSQPPCICIGNDFVNEWFF